MKWTKTEFSTVADTYRQLWPGEVTDLEMAMFCKALSYYKTEHVLEALYHIFSNQEDRRRPAAGRVRSRAAEVKRSDPAERPARPKDDGPRASKEEISKMLAGFYEKIGRPFPSSE
tara:strand:- start:231 stop:578 length:348 start_codon:yes stop_codon:yes gene_type:complete